MFAAGQDSPSASDSEGPGKRERSPSSKDQAASGAASPSAEAPLVSREDWMTKAMPASAPAIPEPAEEKEEAPAKKVAPWLDMDSASPVPCICSAAPAALADK